MSGEREEQRTDALRGESERDLGFILRVLTVADENDMHEDLYWRASPDGARFFVLCNDFFWWACGDLEQITPDNLALLEDSFRVTRPLGIAAECAAPLLFCARSRGMRPQGAYYKHLPESTWLLFDACGPEREASPGNPCSRPSPASLPHPTEPR